MKSGKRAAAKSFSTALGAKVIQRLLGGGRGRPSRRVLPPADPLREPCLPIWTGRPAGPLALHGGACRVSRASRGHTFTTLVDGKWHALNESIDFNENGVIEKSQFERSDQ